MKYTFITPPGWSRSPFPAPQRGVYLRAPVANPSAESASILLFDAVAPAGSLEDHLADVVQQSCEGGKITKQGKPAKVKTAGFSGLTVTVTVQVPSSGGGRGTRDELRAFYLIEAGSERLPVVFIGGTKSLPLHQGALETLVLSIGPLLLAPELYSRWTE
jgi:hypothetical protein